MSLLDKIAKKTFHSEKIQKSWRVHMQAFGPILAPAFPEDYQTRTHLCAALNYISNRNLEKGLKKLQPLQAKCKTDADRAAWLFFMGLVFDMAGLEEAMLDCYAEAGEVGHRFYLPYLKLAKSAHNYGAYGQAEKHYLTAIDCLQQGEAGEQTRLVLASAQINLAACLTRMHRFEEAKASLEASEALVPEFPGRSATAAVLYGAMGKWEQADAALVALQAEAPSLYEQTAKVVEEIRKGRFPQFFPVVVSAEAIDGFWAWFAANECTLVEYLEQGKHEEIFARLQPQVKALFPYLERNPDVALRPLEGGGYELTFADYYMTALRDGYTQLIAARPDSLQKFRAFTIEH